MPSTHSPAAEDDPSGISSVLTASARYFGKMLPPAPVAGSGATAAVRVPAAYNPNSEKKQNLTGRSSSSSRKEADGYYPQSWLIAYFAVNGLRCAAAADAESPLHPPSPPPSSQSSNPPLLAVSGATADALIAALSDCRVEERVHEEELDREVGTSVGDELRNRSGHGDAGASVCILPQWLRRGLLHHSKELLSDVSCNDVALMESNVAVGVAPDGPPRFATVDKSSASAGSAAPALGPTVTLTFCCAQALLGMRRGGGGHHHDGGNDDATDTKDTINSSSSNKRPPSLSLLEEASLALMSGGVKCGGADNGRLLLLFRMALFAWRRLAAFADRLDCSSPTFSCKCSSEGGEGGGLAAPIEDPRDLYSALMLLWLAYKHAHAHETMDTCSSAVEGAIGSSCGRSVASSLQESFVEDTWASCGQPAASAIGNKLRQWIFESCYVPHEGAFGAPPPPPPLLTSSPSRAVEAHSGMTYCCVVSLALLGHGAYRGDAGGVCEPRDRPHSGSTTSSFAPKSQRYPFASALRRYLYARQAHFGLSLSEFEDYSDVSGEDEEEESDEEGCDSYSDPGIESVGSSDSSESVEGSNCADGVGGNFLQELRRLRETPTDRLSEALRRRPQEASLRWPGFQGRPNKDSDTCYSFWALGALRALPSACGDVFGGASADEAATKWDAVDTFLGVDGCPSHMPREQCIEGSSGAGSCRPLLHDGDSLAAFTLLTASAASFSCPSASSGEAGKTLCCAPLSKDADADASPDPLHSALGLAGLTTAGGGVSRRLAAAVFPFI